ncbi:hypothetical protein LPJ73_008955, partial [Coemansia sp. RSA 2703]
IIGGGDGSTDRVRLDDWHQQCAHGQCTSSVRRGGQRAVPDARGDRTLGRHAGADAAQRAARANGAARARDPQQRHKLLRRRRAGHRVRRGARVAHDVRDTGDADRHVLAARPPRRPVRRRAARPADCDRPARRAVRVRRGRGAGVRGL